MLAQLELIVDIGTWRIPIVMSTRSRDKQTFISNQESLIVTLTLSL